tara:strand:+ start:183 stop:1043 length:861 start_codon:yes stop_codon:yes gene_type:complete
MKILITGINGFVGPHLKEELIQNNHEVLGTDITEAEIVDHQADILDKESISKIIQETSPDAIIHLAAQSSVKKSFDDPELTKKINVEGTKNLLEAAPRTKTLIVSSAEVYGTPTTIPITEDAKLKPTSPYGESRVEQEALAKEHNNIIIARSFNHTGPGQQPNFVCSDWAKQIAENQETVKVGDLNLERDISDVRDVVRAYRLLLEKAQPGIYNVCSGQSYKLSKILDILTEGRNISTEQDPSKLRKVDIPILQGDHTKLTKETSWKPEIPIEQTLKDLREYWQQQ